MRYRLSLVEDAPDFPGKSAAIAGIEQKLRILEVKEAGQRKDRPRMVSRRTPAFSVRPPGR